MFRGFDEYTIKAQNKPALLIVLPMLINIIVIFPESGSGALKFLIIGLVTSCGVVLFLSHVARTRGKAKEAELLRLWGGWPTTLMLRHSGGLDKHTRSRYHKFLQKNIVGWPAPSPELERDNLKAADDAYISAVNWLKERTRSKKYYLVKAENIHYGFRRNLLGMKPIGISLYIFFLIINTSVHLVDRYGEVFEVPVKSLNLIEISGFQITIILAIYFIALLCLIGIVNASWVREAGDQYARALLAACEVPLATGSKRRNTPGDAV